MPPFFMKTEIMRQPWLTPVPKWFLEPLWPSKISQTVLFSKPILLAVGKIARIWAESQSGLTDLPTWKSRLAPGKKLVFIPYNISCESPEIATRNLASTESIAGPIHFREQLAGFAAVFFKIFRHQSMVGGREHLYQFLAGLLFFSKSYKGFCQIKVV